MTNHPNRIHLDSTPRPPRGSSAESTFASFPNGAVLATTVGGGPSHVSDALHSHPTADSQFLREMENRLTLQKTPD